MSGINEVRARFEAWADGSYHLQRMGDKYRSAITTDAWRAWQAAVAASQGGAAMTATAIDLGQGLRDLYHAYVRLLESGRDRITSLGGDCDPVDVMERSDIHLRKVRDLLALIDAQANKLNEQLGISEELPPAIDLERIVPPVWLSEQVGGPFDDLTSGQAWRDGFNECRARTLRLAQAQQLALIDGQKAAPRGPDQPDLCDLCRVRDEVRTDAEGIPFCQECWDGWQASEQPSKGEGVAGG